MSNKNPRLRGWMIVYQETLMTDACRFSKGIIEENRVFDQYSSPGKHPIPTPSDMRRALASLSPTKYAFQLEQGANKHYQICIVLEEPLTGREIREKCKSILRKHWVKGCMTTQPLHSQSDAEVYSTKLDTRIEGPWYFPPNKYLGQDLRSPKKYYPWQRSILAIAKKKTIDPRSIHVIFDDKGNTGKSELAKYMAYHINAVVIPLGLSSAQMKAAITSSDPARNYIIDLPRNNRSYQDIFDTVEEIKRGFVISSFHGKLKNSFFDRPNVFVFTNSMPDLRLMSIDMWRLHKIDSITKELVSIDTYSVLYEQNKARIAKRKSCEKSDKKEK